MDNKEIHTSEKEIYCIDVQDVQDKIRKKREKILSRKVTQSQL